MGGNESEIRERVKEEILYSVISSHHFPLPQGGPCIFPLKWVPLSHNRKKTDCIHKNPAYLKPVYRIGKCTDRDNIRSYRCRIFFFCISTISYDRNPKSMLYFQGIKKYTYTTSPLIPFPIYDIWSGGQGRAQEGEGEREISMNNIKIHNNFQPLPAPSYPTPFISYRILLYLSYSIPQPRATATVFPILLLVCTCLSHI